jgi:2-polyprenyl-3-methyl-5-hydroxy-6-metoxy-1,4-benzoquinol methylase
LPFRNDRVSRDEWEKQYSNKEWDHLERIDELARYSVIAGYAAYFRKPDSILDIGCGKGILHGKLLPLGFSRYVGIDLSKEAIRSASACNAINTSFLCEDASHYKTDERFDVIIFNECLYYFSDPLELLKRYEQFLREDGLMIASMHDRDKTRALWAAISRRYDLLDSTSVTNRNKTSWVIACWKPR